MVCSMLFAEASTSSGRVSPSHDETGLRWHTATHSGPEKGTVPFRRLHISGTALKITNCKIWFWKTLF